MQLSRIFTMAVAGLLATGAAQAAGSIFITEPGAGNQFSINTLGFNGSSYDITKLTFDFTTTHTTDGSHVVIGDTPSIVAPVGGSATYFGGGAVFGFTFTGFGTFEKFSFAWDPDSAISGSYGATGLDFINGQVTAETTGGTYFGTFALVGNGPDVTAALSPVPESGAFTLTFAGLAIAAGLLARRRAPQA